VVGIPEGGALVGEPRAQPRPALLQHAEDALLRQRQGAGAAQEEAAPQAQRGAEERHNFLEVGVELGRRLHGEALPLVERAERTAGVGAARRRQDHEVEIAVGREDLDLFVVGRAKDLVLGRERLSRPVLDSAQGGQQRGALAVGTAEEQGLVGVLELRDELTSLRAHSRVQARRIGDVHRRHVLADVPHHAAVEGPAVELPVDARRAPAAQRVDAERALAWDFEHAVERADPSDGGVGVALARGFRGFGGQRLPGVWDGGRLALCPCAAWWGARQSPTR